MSSTGSTQARTTLWFIEIEKIETETENKTKRRDTLQALNIQFREFISSIKKSTTIRIYLSVYLH